LSDEKAKWSWSDFSRISSQVADAFRCLHSHGLPHRDIDAGDILVSFPTAGYSAFDGSQGASGVHAVLANFGITQSQHRRVYVFWLRFAFLEYCKQMAIYKALKIEEPRDAFSLRQQFAHDVAMFGMLLQRMLVRFGPKRIHELMV